MEVRQLMDTLAGEEDPVVCTDGYEHHGDRSGWTFSVKFKGKVVREQSGEYTSTI